MELRRAYHASSLIQFLEAVDGQGYVVSPGRVPGTLEGGVTNLGAPLGKNYAYLVVCFYRVGGKSRPAHGTKSAANAIHGHLDSIYREITIYGRAQLRISAV